MTIDITHFMPPPGTPANCNDADDDWSPPSSWRVQAYYANQAEDDEVIDDGYTPEAAYYDEPYWP